MKANFSILLPTVLAAAIVAGMSGRAPDVIPDVRWVKVTKIEFKAGGAVTRFVARMAGANSETTETTYLSGDRKRTDRGESSSTIVDLAAGTTTEIDHEQKTVRVIPFAYYRNTAASALVPGQPSQPEPPPPGESKEPEYEVTFDLDVTEAGESERMLGSRASRWFITLTGVVTPKERAEAEAAENPEEGAPPPGKLVLLSDVWLLPELPGAEEMNDFDRRMAVAILGDEAMAAFRDVVTSTAQPGAPGVGPGPGYAEAMARLKEELSKLEGTPVRSTSHMVSVPNEMEFDRDLALGVEKKKKGGLGGLARGLAQRALNQQQQESAPTQQTIFTVTEETTEAGTDPVDTGIFAIPAGYRVIDVAAGGEN